MSAGTSLVREHWDPHQESEGHGPAFLQGVQSRKDSRIPSSYKGGAEVNDTIPLWFAIPATILAIVGYIVLEFRASARFWAERDAADPVVVTASGVRRDPYPRACKSFGGVR